MIIKSWEIHLSDWSGGRTKQFFFKENALQWAKKNASEWLFVDINNLLTRYEKRLKDNPDKIKMRITSIEQPETFNQDEDSLNIVSTYTQSKFEFEEIREDEK